MNSKFSLFLLIPFLFLAIGCDRVVDEAQDDEMARLDAWLKVNNITTTPNPSGLYYINKQVGTGATPADSNWLIYSYVARSIDDVVYETTIKDTAKLYDIFGIYSTTTHYGSTYRQFFSKSIPTSGLAEGLSMMKEGGKARLIIPSKIGFGKNGFSLVPAYTTIIYDVELQKVVVDPNAYEQSLITAYLEANVGFTTISDSIYYKKITDGTVLGGVAKDSVVQVNYTGRFLDGFIFDTNIKSVAIDSNIYSTSKTYTPLEFTIGANTVKPGFEMAVKQMIQGEKAIVVIPSAYMYGEMGSSDGATAIPPYATLIFELELVDVVGKTTTK
jgi:FKBP-type peptidyl-prolyl cis-trans isomerase